MTKVDIYSGFLGAGKTTLIKKMIQEAYKGEKLVLIENEFGEIGVDGGFLQDAGINITEMNSGCICCTLVGDFGKALTQVIREYAPDRILIEPSGVGKLSDVIGAVNKVTDAQVVLGNAVAVADVGKVKVYMKNFGEFYNNQIETAGTIILSRTNAVPQNKLDAAVELLRQHNPHAVIITTPWDQLTGEQILDAMGGHASLAAEMSALEHEHHEHHHDHDEHCTCGCHDHEHHHEHHEHHHDHDEHCTCGCHDHEHHHAHHEHHHDHDEYCTCGCHDHEHRHEHHEHHHDHDEHCTCGCHDHEHHHEHHEHHHDHDEHCTCGCHEHHHDHGHHADEVFTSWGVETARKFDKASVEEALHRLNSGEFGMVLRAKGILPAADGSWIHFDFVPDEYNVRLGTPDIIGKLCVIGSKLNEAGIAGLFGV